MDVDVSCKLDRFGRLRADRLEVLEQEALGQG